MTQRWRDHRTVASVLDGADLAYVAVSSRHGPHVTPAVFDVDGDRLWFVTPRRSVKARVIARRRRVGALVRLGHWSVMIGGPARISDPLTARGVSPVALLDLPFAAAGYLSRNLRHAVATVRDHPAPTLALSRVLVSIEVRRLALLDGWTVIDTWGRWAEQDQLFRTQPAGDGIAPDLTGVPPVVRRLVHERSAAVLGWSSPDGPLALPARWCSGGGELETSAEALALAGGLPLGPASICTERSGHRLADKYGLLLAGTGRAARTGDGAAAGVRLDTGRTTWWIGEDGHTVAAQGV